jgi:hypothetical protein
MLQAGRGKEVESNEVIHGGIYASIFNNISRSINADHDVSLQRERRAKLSGSRNATTNRQMPHISLLDFSI